MMTQIFGNRLKLAISNQEKLLIPITAYLESKGFLIKAVDDKKFLMDRKGDIPPIQLDFVRARDAMLLLEEEIVDLAIIERDVSTGATLRQYQLASTFEIVKTTAFYSDTRNNILTQILANEFVRELKGRDPIQTSPSQYKEYAMA